MDICEGGRCSWIWRHDGHDTDDWRLHQRERPAHFLLSLMAAILFITSQNLVMHKSCTASAPRRAHRLIIVVDPWNGISLLSRPPSVIVSTMLVSE
jgi:hypothetical protein